ncbi:MAG: DUF4424 domain-containing protein [Mesorhizobium sp.]
MRRFLFVAFSLFMAWPAAANDTTAELETGGLVFTRTDAIEMESEDLFISRDEVRVAYKFRNVSDEDVETIVAFPMPDIDPAPETNLSIPDMSSDNFLDFKVTIDGKDMQPALDQRAFAVEVDVTDELRRNAIPLFPYDDSIDRLVSAKPEDLRKDWLSRGIIAVQSYDIGDGKGMVDHYAPGWKLKSTYWWRMTFPTDRVVDVRHTYKPSVGGTVGLNFVEDGKVGGDQIDYYRTTYCVDEAFERAVQKAVSAAGEDTTPYYESWISYVLTTGGNWRSSIGKFKLTIDKGAPENLVSFCGEGVTKTGATTFEMTAEDFYPEDDLYILLLTKPDPVE